MCIRDRTTTALAVAAGLSLKGYSVLSIDLDAQSNMTYTAGAKADGATALGAVSYTHLDVYKSQMPQREAEPDYTSFFLQANRDIAKTSYHRGLTLETLNRFKLGDVESWTHPKAPQAPPSPRLIIPTSKHS